jgi:PAS domain S-box-containing protein
MQVLHRDKDGTPAAILEVNNDVTNLRRAEETLRSTQQQLQLVTDNTDAAVTRCSRSLRYVWVSRGYAAWIGRTAEEIAGRAIQEVIGEEGYEDIRPLIERVLSGESVEYTTQVQFIGPGKRWIRAVYVPTYSNAQEVDGWIGVVMDITEEKRTEKQQRQTQRLESLGILAGASHMTLTTCW